MSHPDIHILDQLKEQPEIALKVLYDKFYNYICSVVYKMVGDSTLAEDISQEVFVEVWKRRDSLDVNLSLRGYLRRVAVNKTLNYIRAQKMNFEDEDTILQVPSTENSVQKILEAKDLERVINDSIDSLPERCRVVFGLSRFEELSYKEISSELGISVKTVENQISKALKLVRKAVLDYEE
jgi:RNA polymerase sigma-70 factor (ECF subfamily)